MKIGKIFYVLTEKFKGVRYWNPSLKNEFLQRTLGLWRDYCAEPITHQEMEAREREEELALKAEENFKQIK